MKTRHMRISAFLGVGLVAMQFYPAERSNPPVRSMLDAPPEVLEILQRSCFDCHSNRTRWPWYSRVAPFSWLVASDVREARDELNFTEWDDLDPAGQAHKRREIGKQVTEGEMPLWYYLKLNPGARLSDGDRAVLVAWAGAGQATDDNGSDDDPDHDHEH